MLLLVVLNGDNHFFYVVLFDELFHIPYRPQAGDNGREAALCLAGAVGIDRDEPHEYVARIFLLVLEVEIGLIGLVVAANEQGGESQLAAVNFSYGAGGLNDTAEVGEPEVDQQQEHEREVVASVVAHLVVEHQGKE